MKLITFEANQGLKIGALINDEYVVDLQRAYQEKLASQGEANSEDKAKAIVPEKTNDFLKGGENTLNAASKALDFVIGRLKTSKAVFHKNDVKINAPVPEPNKIICVGHNYREHILEMKRELPDYPVLFAKFSNTVIGPEDDIPYYPITEKLDYEAEFAVVIGKTAKDVPREEALEYVVGYTIVNDVSARDLQKRTIQWLQGKGVDGSAPMGPYLVTKDEIPIPEGLEISLTVNGEERQRSNTSNLVFNVEHLIEYLSSIMTLEPGDVICTGTPGGVGTAMEPPTYLQDGDKVAITVDKIGTLENKVKKIEKEKVKEYANKINSCIDQIVNKASELPEELLRWKSTDEKWSILEVLSHVEEANRFWIQELKQTLHKPKIKWGRGLDHNERLAAVKEVNMIKADEVISKIRQFKTTIRGTLLTLDDNDLEITTTHKNPKFGEKPLAFLIDHFMVEHLEKHMNQIERNIQEYKSQAVVSK